MLVSCLTKPGYMGLFNCEGVVKGKKYVAKGRSSKSKSATKAGKPKRTARFNWRRLRPRLPKYFREAVNELKKVTWPTRREAWKLTLAVFIFSGVFTLFIVIMDNLFKFIAEELFL